MPGVGVLDVHLAPGNTLNGSVEAAGRVLPGQFAEQGLGGNARQAVIRIDQAGRGSEGFVVTGVEEGIGEAGRQVVGPAAVEPGF